MGGSRAAESRDETETLSKLIALADVMGARKRGFAASGGGRPLSVEGFVVLSVAIARDVDSDAAIVDLVLTTTMMMLADIRSILA